MAGENYGAMNFLLDMKMQDMLVRMTHFLKYGEYKNAQLKSGKKS